MYAIRSYYDKIGFNNLWKAKALDQEIKILSAPCYLATKFEAFNHRGIDYRTSRITSYNVCYTKLLRKYEYVANVEPVTQNGVKLSASHMVIDGTYAYVTYNTYGNRYGGAVQIIDLVDASKPKIVSQLLFPESDINAITIDRTLAQPKAWLAASTNKNGAEIYEVALSSIV